jgi:hypothetical protein
MYTACFYSELFNIKDLFSPFLKNKDYYIYHPKERMWIEIVWNRRRGNDEISETCTVRSFTITCTFHQILLRLSRRMEGAVNVGHVETMRCVNKILVGKTEDISWLEKCWHNDSVIFISGS